MRSGTLSKAKFILTGISGFGMSALRLLILCRWVVRFLKYKNQVMFVEFVIDVYQGVYKITILKLKRKLHDFKANFKDLCYNIVVWMKLIWVYNCTFSLYSTKSCVINQQNCKN